MPQSYLKRILDVRTYALETLLDEPSLVSDCMGNPCGRSKFVGGYNNLLHLTDKQRAGAAIAASAGNRSNALALWVKHIGVNATIVMPNKHVPFSWMLSLL